MKAFIIDSAPSELLDFKKEEEKDDEIQMLTFVQETDRDMSPNVAREKEKLELEKLRAEGIR